MKRTVGNLVLQSILPFGYLLGFSYFSSMDGGFSSLSAYLEESPLLLNLLAVSVLLPLLCLSLAWFWALNDWARHPFVSSLARYANGGDWRQVGRDVEREFRRIDKFSIRPSPLSCLVVTDNWLVVTGCWPWSCHLSHQSDVSLQIVNSEQHRISTEGHIGGSQFLHIKVSFSSQRWRDISQQHLPGHQPEAGDQQLHHKGERPGVQELAGQDPGINREPGEHHHIPHSQREVCGGLQRHRGGEHQCGGH